MGHYPLKLMTYVMQYSFTFRFLNIFSLLFLLLNFHWSFSCIFFSTQNILLCDFYDYAIRIPSKYLLARTVHSYGSENSYQTDACKLFTPFYIP